jgi:K+-transporting ATPase ATPase C chain
MAAFFSSFRAALALLAVFTLLLGALYPLLVTGVAQFLFPGAANGSLIEKDGTVIGSRLLAQPFTSPCYFWARPSATTPPYHAASSGGSNLGPGNPQLAAQVRDRMAALVAYPVEANAKAPIDLLSASASGLDPHISLASAYYQAPRIARLRGVPLEEVRLLVETQAEQGISVLFGTERVNVLMLNLALDADMPLNETRRKNACFPKVEKNG